MSIPRRKLPTWQITRSPLPARGEVAANAFRERSEGAYSKLILALLLLLTLTACDNGPTTTTDEPEEPTLITHDHSNFDTDDLPNLTTPEAHHTVDLSLGVPQRFDACHTIFEPDGQPIAWPVDDSDIAPTLFGCDAEGYLELSEGRRALAYETPNPEHDGLTDLRMVVYDASGDVAWTHRIRRHRYAENFAANYIGSYLTAVGDTLLCAGSRWLRTTQLACARQDSGDVEMDRHLELWIGLPFFSAHNSLFSADTRGITRRYPFTGSEMRHRSFSQRLGRGSFFATDYEHIFVVPDDDTPLLHAWTLEDPERPDEFWRAQLPGHPHIAFYAADTHHQLLLVRIDETLFGLDTTDGEIRMAFHVGDTSPHVAFSEDLVYLLLRPPGEDPAIYAIDPTDGVVHWAGKAPPGTLTIDHRQGRLLTRTVRTVREIEPPE